MTTPKFLFSFYSYINNYSYQGAINVTSTVFVLSVAT
jgi:hypothetical protein